MTNHINLIAGLARTGNVIEAYRVAATIIYADGLSLNQATAKRLISEFSYLNVQQTLQGGDLDDAQRARIETNARELWANMNPMKADTYRRAIESA